MRRTYPLLIAGLLLASACGASPPETTGPAPPAGTTLTTVAPVATTQLSGTVTTAPPATSSTTEASPDVTTGAAPAPPERIFASSVIALAGDIGDRGRFRLLPSTRSIVPKTEGRYWVDGAGTVFTSLDVDTELIAREMDRLVGRIRAQRPETSAYLASLAEHYTGDQFQLDLVDMMLVFGVGPLLPDVIEQWIGFAEEDPGGEAIPAELYACLGALYDYVAAAERYVSTLQPQFTPDGDGGETWEFPVEDHNRALAAEIAATDVCSSILEGSRDGVRLGFTRRPAGAGTAIEVWWDEGIYAEPRVEDLFTVFVVPDPATGDAPPQRNPVPLLTLVNTFLVTIDECGELPWIYSNFAAANSYYAPDDPFYNGPTWTSSDWLCADDVPEDARNQN